MDEGLAQVPVPVAELAAQSDPPVISQEQASTDIEAGTVVKVKRKRKTTQNDHSHGSFFLRIGAIGNSNNTNDLFPITLNYIISIRFGNYDLQRFGIWSVF